MYALIEKYDRISSRLHDKKYESTKFVENYFIHFIIDIKSNFLT